MPMQDICGAVQESKILPTYRNSYRIRKWVKNSPRSPSFSVEACSAATWLGATRTSTYGDWLSAS